MKQILINELLKDGIGTNNICINCKEQNNMYTRALTPYIISEKNTAPKDRIMFIGKVARGDDFGEPINDNYEDVTSFGEEFIETSSWEYYSYTKEIIETFYGDSYKALSHITFSNPVKCNNGTTNDSAPEDAKICCIDQNQFVWKEVNIINPRHIIFYTHYYYDNYIEKFRPNNFSSFKDITDREYRIPIGRKTSVYWHRDFFDKENKIICSFLRVSHPMMKNREDFIDTIPDWLNRAD